MNRKALSFLSGAIFALVIGGCATTGNTPAAESAAAAQQVPRLKVKVDCDCQVRPNARDLIVQGYTEAAARKGVTVANDQEATVLVKEYVARDDTARMLVGVFSGKDEIKVSVTYKEKSFEVEDYYRNSWLGISALSQKIGELILDRMN